MKKLFLTVCFALSFASSLLAAEVKSPAAKIRKAIDDICGDTWCEGDYQFAFQKVTMKPSTNSTKVFFTMKSYDDSGLDVTPPETKGFVSRIESKTYAVTCEVQGYSTFQTVMQTDSTLNWDFYLALTDCIQALETKLRL